MDGEAPGPQVAYGEDTNGVQAVLPPLAIEQDGRHLVVFSSWDDPGQGRYEVTVGCDGTDFQCLRPVQERQCTEGTRYIQGGQTLQSETWHHCTVVLLETTTVAANEVLTINPGVHVQGNYLGESDYGQVRLIVEGTLQAVGAEEAPIRFSALESGWSGINLNGPSNSLEHVFIENAGDALRVRRSNNRFREVSINNGHIGLAIQTGSLNNHIDGVTFRGVDIGLRLSGAAEIADSVFVGNGSGTGVHARQQQGL